MAQINFSINLEKKIIEIDLKNWSELMIMIGELKSITYPDKEIVVERVKCQN